MTPQAILSELRTRGVELFVDGDALRYRAPKGALTPELRHALQEHKPAILTALTSAKDANSAKDQFGTLGPLDSYGGQPSDLTAGTVAAVLLKSAVLDGALVWLVADADVLADHPGIIRAGFPVFFFDDVERLRGKTPTELKAIAMVKATFPGSRVLQ